MKNGFVKRITLVSLVLLTGVLVPSSGHSQFQAGQKRTVGDGQGVSVKGLPMGDGENPGSSTGAMAEQFRVAENLRHKQIQFPASIPDTGPMAVVDYTMVTTDNGVSGILILYDDPRTKREVDYIEFYDLEGNLLLVSWIDRFGACQVAVDRGLLNVDKPEVDGTLVLISVGRQL